MVPMQFQWNKYNRITAGTGVFPVLAAVILFASGCRKDEVIPSYVLDIPTGFPEMEIPADNELTRERVELGKKLFFDKMLSSDYSVSCASCHLPEYGFSDPEQFSRGVGNATGFRNSVSLANVGYNTLFFRDGGSLSLELQIEAPLTSAEEMNMTYQEIMERLNNDATYPDLFMKAYNREPDPFSITRAIAAYERTLISGNSRYDKYFYQGNENALTESEKRGMELFNSSKTNCSQCHGGFNFTSFGFENNGLYEFYADSGRARITTLSTDAGKFKVPTLRNIAVTAPYMHDGSISTLEEVIAHYESGGKTHENKSQFITGFQLSSQEKTDLINFLNSLTDYDFISQSGN